MTPALEVVGLRAGYADGDDIVRGIDLTVAPESILAVIGPNGSGKSSFIRTLAGLLRPRAGHIRLTGDDVTQASPARRVAAGLAYVPQEHNVFASMTIRENLLVSAEFLRARPGVGPALTADILRMFPDLAARPRTLAGDLSGGQRQMLAFACALLSNPEVILLDEPSAGLSPRLVSEVMGAIGRVREAGVTVVLVEQNVQAALRVADTVMVLVAGQCRLLAPACSIEVDGLAELFFGPHQGAA